MDYHYSLSRLISSFTSYLFPLLLGLVWLPMAQAATNCAAQTDIPQTECEALVALYTNLDGANWVTSPDNGWNQNDFPCSWWGVDCVNFPTPANVKVIYLRESNFSGSLPTQLGNLASLEVLVLQRLWEYYNYTGTWSAINGSIPAELGSLTNLKILDLSYNDLSGPIPTQLGNASSLEVLNLIDNELTTIPTQLGNLSSLKTLDLRGNNFNGASIPTELGNLSNLETLNLGYSGLSNSIPTQLGSLSNLKILNLSYNDLSGPIPAELGNLSSLEELYLRDNKFDGTSIPIELGNLSSTNLKTLDLASSGLTGSIPTQLGNLTSLRYLYLGCSSYYSGYYSGYHRYCNRANADNLSGSIPTEFGNLTNLYTLDLGDNQLSGDIPSSFTALTSLTYLNLACNQLTVSDSSVVTFMDTKYPNWTGNVENKQGESSNCPANTAPTTPTNLVAKGTSQTNIDLTWNDNSKIETGFVVKRDSTPIATPTTLTNITNYSDTVTCSTTYNYTVFATNTYGDSTTSSTITGTTFPCDPTDFAATQFSTTQIDLTWTDVADETSYTIKRDGVQIATIAANTTSYSNTGLTGNTTYNYSITASNTNGDSQATTATGTTSVSTPNAPTGLLTTTISETAINLTWTDNSGTETGFIVKRDGTPLASPTTATDIANYSDTGLTCNTTYNYSVVATNAIGDSTPSPTISGTTTPCIPTDFIATQISTSQIDLTWTDIADETNYIIKRDGPTIATIAADTTSYSDMGLTIDGTYNYSVIATNANGDSQPATAVGTTSSTAPSAPANLTAPTISSTTIDLTWNDNSSDENGFIVKRDGTPIATTTTDIFNYSDTDLTCNTTYNYSVVATNASGDSTPSPIISETTSLCPTGLNATPVSASQIALTWTDVVDETGYLIERDGVQITTIAADTTSYSNSGLSCGTTYSYSVKATNAVGDSTATSASATTSACPPPPASDTPIPFFQLKIDKIGDGTVIADGINCGSDCSQGYQSGTEVMLTTTVDKGWLFKEWAGDCDSNGNVFLYGDKSCTVTFVQEHTLTIKTIGQGTVEDCDTECTQTYLDGETVTLTPIPAPDGWRFIEWSGNCDAEGQVVMTADQSCTAHFDLLNISLSPTTLNLIEGSTMGSYTVELNIAPTTTITLSPNRNGELFFSPQILRFDSKNWNIPQRITVADVNDNLVTGLHSHIITHTISSSNADYKNIIIDDVTVNVTDDDESKNSLLTVTLTGEGQGTVTSKPAGITCGTDCIYEYPNGTEVLLIAEADNSSKFANWSGHCSSNETQVLVTLSETQTCEAKFEIDLAKIDSIKVDSPKIDSAKHVSLEGGITLACDGCTVKNAALESVDAQPIAPGDFSFPEGLVNFELSDLSDSSTQFAIYYSNLDLLSNNALDRFIYRKYGPTIPGDPNSAAWYNFSNVTIELVILDGKPQIKVNLLFVDGELGDDTGVDGRIIDPGGIALSTTTDNTPIVNNDDPLLPVENTINPSDNPSDETPIVTSEPVETYISSPPVILPSSLNPLPQCKTNSGEVTDICNVGNQIFPDELSISNGASVSNAIFESSVNNHGLISNSTIAPEATVTGGTLSGNIDNKGTIADVEFVGISLTGGTLSGNVTNNSQVGGIIEDVQLAPDATLTGGKIGGEINAAPDSTLQDVQLTAGTKVSGGTLTGEISGDPNNPPMITTANIAPSTVLSNVRISPSVDLPADVILGPGVILPSEPPTLEDFGFDAADIANLDADSLGKLEPAIFGTLSPENLATISPEAMSNLSPEQLAFVKAETLEALSLEQFEQMPKEALGGLTADNMEGMPVELMGEFSGEQLAEIKPEALQGMEEEQLEAIPPEAISEIVPEQMAELPKDTLGGLSTEQFEQLPAEALSGLQSENMGGLSTDVLNNFTPEHLSALDAGEFTQMPSSDVSKLFTNFDATKISIQNAAQFVPPGWKIDLDTGAITAPEGAKLTPRTLPASGKVPAGVKLPQMADIGKGMGLGGQGTSVKENMTRSLEDEDLTNFELSQNEETGILWVEGTGDAEGVKYTFIPDIDNVIQVDGDKIPIGLAVTEGGFYTITTPDEKQYKVIPAPQDPIALSEMLGGGEVVVGKRGDVLMEIKTSTRQRGKARQVVIFDPLIELAPDDLCVEIEPEETESEEIEPEVVCDFDNAPDAMKPGLHLSSGKTRKLEKAKVVYPDGTSQTIMPTLLSPDVFTEVGLKFEGVEKIIFNSNGVFYVLHKGNGYLVMPNFKVETQPSIEETSEEEETVSPSIVINGGENLSLTYTIPYESQEEVRTRKRGKAREVLIFEPLIELAPDDLCVEIMPEEGEEGIEGEIICDFDNLPESLKQEASLESSRLP
ncbi:hypothetical protein [Candidatus Parabeggiatoa sp. HSG14]|uniref:fibronectin type III domain-containing protein n=1 Tax=Candidatus Parabeggiatoa sp. HSG14 TaxID=3055593 RepID=UPI0025A8A9FD|nr:hypothetical protein [Thiotrichales bacterium HSG14]